MSVCRVIVGTGDADALGDPPADALGDPPANPLADPDDWITGVNDDAGLLVLLETHPAMTMISTKASGGAAIKNGVRRQKGFGP